MLKNFDICKEIEKDFGIRYESSNINWGFIARTSYISQENFFKYLKFISERDLIDIIFNRRISETEIIKISEISKACAKYALTIQYFSDTVLEKLLNDEYSFVISRYQNLSESFIDKHKDELNWNIISEYQTLSEDFIETHKSYVIFKFLMKNEKLSQDFIYKYKKEISWFDVFFYQKLSNDFIVKITKEHLYPQYYCKTLINHQELSEDTIEIIKNEFDKLENSKKTECSFYWDDVVKSQKLSTDFILKYIKLINLELVARYQKVDARLERRVKKYKSYKDNWIYKSAEEKKQAVIDTGLYECYDDYFIAYKAVRADRYSLYNFQYKYEKGGVYESWCDCSGKNGSFGLSVGTHSYAENYINNRNGIILRCKIEYKDIGRLVCGDDKIRCFKIEILD